MKASTMQIYDLVTSELFDNIDKNLLKVVKEHGWEIPDRNESTNEETLEDLANCLDVIKQACENNVLDKAHPSHRSAILQTLVLIQATIVNINASHQQFAQLQDAILQLMTQLMSYRIDSNTDNVPRYTQKIKEYNDLIKKLKIVVENFDEISDKREEFIQLTSEIQSTLDDFKIQKDKTDKLEEQITNKHQVVTELYTKAENLVSIISDYKESANIELQSAKSSKLEIKNIENDIKLFLDDIEESKTKIDDLSIRTKENMKTLHIDSSDAIDEFMIRTNAIIDKNEAQTYEIDKQLARAVGASLFKSFDVRRKILNKEMIKWLRSLALSVAVLIAISFWIYSEIASNENANIYLFIFKIVMSFPFIFVVAFIASRYSKERRLEEEYAFKSSISLALKPYSDLVANMTSDPAHKEFLIESIRNIFTEPTERVFGQKKESSSDVKKLNEYIDVIKKLTDVKVEA